MINHLEKVMGAFGLKPPDLWASVRADPDYLPGIRKAVMEPDEDEDSDTNEPEDEEG